MVSTGDLFDILKRSKTKSEFVAAYRAKDNLAPIPYIEQIWDAYVRSGGRMSNEETTSDSNLSIASLIGAQEQKGFMMGISEEAIKGEKIVKDFGKAIKDLKSEGGAEKVLYDYLGKAEDEVLKYYSQQSELIGIINKKAGLTGELAKDYREELTRANPALLRIGIGFQELSNAALSLITNTGKFLMMNKDSWYQAGEKASAYVGSLEELVNMYPSFMKVGVGASAVAEQIERIGHRSMSLGLRAQTTTKELGASLGKLNEYGFKRGIDGLGEMVRKSVEFRMSMDSVFKVAEKVFSPEGAVDLAANLQAIGGAIGDFNDPLKLMYMATNNVEGLQDALIGVAGSLATYNEEQGRFEVTGINLRKARALADSLGVSYGELADMAIASAERTVAATDLMASGLKLDDDQKRFITNLAQMKGGRMVIELNSDILKGILGENGRKEVAIEDLTQEELNQLEKYQEEIKKLSSKEIVEKQATDIENITRDVNYVASLLRIEAGKTGQKLVQALGYDPVGIAAQSKIIADKIAPFASGWSGKLRIGEQENIINKPTTEPLKTNGANNSTGSKLGTAGGVETTIETTEDNTTTKTVNHQYNIAFSSNTYWDSMMKQVAADQVFVNYIKKTSDPREYNA